MLVGPKKGKQKKSLQGYTYIYIYIYQIILKLTSLGQRRFLLTSEKSLDAAF